jgi:hypothetical protein
MMPFNFFALHGTGPTPEVSADLEGGTDSKIRNKLKLKGGRVVTDCRQSFKFIPPMDCTCGGKSPALLYNVTTKHRGCYVTHTRCQFLLKSHDK